MSKEVLRNVSRKHRKELAQRLLAHEREVGRMIDKMWKGCDGKMDAEMFTYAEGRMNRVISALQEIRQEQRLRRRKSND